jgi:hypothetical protein
MLGGAELRVARVYAVATCETGRLRRLIQGGDLPRRKSWLPQTRRARRRHSASAPAVRQLERRASTQEIILPSLRQRISGGDGAWELWPLTGSRRWSSAGEPGPCALRGGPGDAGRRDRELCAGTGRSPLTEAVRWSGAARDAGLSAQRRRGDGQPSRRRSGDLHVVALTKAAGTTVVQSYFSPKPAQ